MTAPLAIILGSGNSLVWSWFFWVYIHPIASILWFTFCLFALLISIEVRQLEQSEVKFSRMTYVKNPKPIQPVQYVSSAYASNTRGFSATEVIEVIVNPPPQLPSYTKAAQKRTPQVAIAQLPSSID